MESPLTQLSLHDQASVMGCLWAAVNGPFFSDFEFSSLFGMTRSELRALINRKPAPTFDEPDLQHAIGNALNNLSHFPIAREPAWPRWLTVSREEVRRLNEKWHRLLPCMRFAGIQTYGPVQIGNEFFRVITFRVIGGDEGIVSEQWTDGRWQHNVNGPGCNTILSMRPAVSEALVPLGIDSTPAGQDYDPLRSS